MSQTAYILCIQISLLHIAGYAVLSQATAPDLTLKRTVVRWPMIDIYYTAEYNHADITKNLQKSNFTIREDGKEVTDFSLECITSRLPVSVALVIDASGEMVGPPGYYGRHGADTFLTMLDSTLDEAAVISYSDTVIVWSHLSQDFPAVRTSLDSPFRRPNAPLPPGTDGGIWDGVWTGLDELAYNAKNPLKALIIFSVQEHNICIRDSCRSFWPDMIRFAQQHDIHCFVITCGQYTRPEKQLDSLGYYTGGIWYFGDGSFNGYYYTYETPALFVRAATSILNGYDECKLSYKSQCPDGTKRNIEVEFSYP